MFLGEVAPAMLNTANAKKAPWGMPLKKRKPIKTSALLANELLKLPKKHQMLKNTKVLCLLQLRQTMANKGAPNKPPQK